jgi:hypothetical protein
VRVNSLEVAEDDAWVTYRFFIRLPCRISRRKTRQGGNDLDLWIYTSYELPEWDPPADGRFDAVQDPMAHVDRLLHDREERLNQTMMSAVSGQDCGPSDERLAMKQHVGCTLLHHGDGPSYAQWAMKQRVGCTPPSRQSQTDDRLECSTVQTMGELCEKARVPGCSCERVMVESKTRIQSRQGLELCKKTSLEHRRVEERLVVTTASTRRHDPIAHDP